VHADIAGPVIVTGNQAQLGRLITNLLDNALRHAHSQVRVTLSATDTTAVLTIADDGPGVPPESRERIFERFIRLDPTGTRSGWHRLGLALVKESPPHTPVPSKSTTPTPAPSSLSRCHSSRRLLPD